MLSGGEKGERCERHVSPLSFSAPELGPRRRGTCPGHQVRRGWPAWAGMASIHPLPGPDAKNPAFPTISFLTNSSVGPALAGTPARAAPVGAPPAAAPAAAPSSESGLAAALREAGIADGRVPGVYKDEADGHSACPWRSGIRREGFEHVKSGRHASCAEASLRVLLLLQAHPGHHAR